MRSKVSQHIIPVTMTTQRMALALVGQLAIFGFGFYLRRSDRELQRGIGIVLQILSVLVTVIVLIRWGIAD